MFFDSLENQFEETDMRPRSRLACKELLGPLTLLFIVIAVFILAVPARAVLPIKGGACSTCHTMHNSQNGSTMVFAGTGAAWDGSNQLAGGTSTSPQDSLLVTDCVGCHSSDTSNTIITIGTLRIPIVFNTGGYPSSPLAGGNFYNVSIGGAANDVYGHNVYGISEQDNNIPPPTPGAPGSLPPATTFDPTCMQQCHGTLAIADTQFGPGGCTGCHLRSFGDAVRHHESPSWYRFLRGHDFSALRQVEGVPDPDWEQTPSFANSNKYKGVDDATTYIYDFGSLELTQSISDFCSGCHANFHEDMDGASSTWIRHPSDSLLPETGEFAAYNPITSYNNLAPVAYIDPDAPVRSEAVVMCLSCHRAHGSQYPDILRWDYTGTCSPGTANANCGCFVCHTEKD